MLANIGRILQNDSHTKRSENSLAGLTRSLEEHIGSIKPYLGTASWFEYGRTDFISLINSALNESSRPSCVILEFWRFCLCSRWSFWVFPYFTELSNKMSSRDLFQSILQRYSASQPLSNWYSILKISSGTPQSATEETLKRLSWLNSCTFDHVQNQGEEKYFVMNANWIFYKLLHIKMSKDWQ